jgi:catechol 2,3-dioxygenase
MDAPNPSAIPGLATRAPMHIGAIGLKARDLNQLTAFYRDVLGLALLSGDSHHAILGTGEVDLLHLERAAGAAADDPHTAGLYHTAFLMPTRADLARWLRHAGAMQVPLTGASDHSVSEAIYLDDPEGNGIEVYCDRPPETWHWSDGSVAMMTKRLDLDELVREADNKARYELAPEGLRIGHVHLRAGNLPQAEAFYHDAIGLDVTRRRDGALFMSSGRYHHHVACNIWHSQGAGMRDPGRAGLAWLSMDAIDGAAVDAIKAKLNNAGTSMQPIPGALETADPWGTKVRLRVQNR